ncbi:MAG TPA: hypothetical protein VKF36_12715 [Syntrophorhabdales bacterium]|nr:hypothetical protein [Syntrophorhabdales bacterium]
MADLSFSQQIIVAVVDKGGLGVVLVLAGLLANRLLERYKASQAIREEVAKERLKQIAPIWEELNQTRKEFNLVFIKAISAVVSKSELKEASGGFKELKERIDKISKEVVLNRFWLGKRLWELHQAHLKDLNSLVVKAEKQLPDFGKGDFDLKRFEDFKNLVDREVQSRLDIDDVMRLL